MLFIKLPFLFVRWMLNIELGYPATLTLKSSFYTRHYFCQQFWILVCLISYLISNRGLPVVDLDLGQQYVEFLSCKRGRWQYWILHRAKWNLLLLVWLWFRITSWHGDTNTQFLFQTHLCISNPADIAIQSCVTCFIMTKAISGNDLVVRN